MNLALILPVNFIKKPDFIKDTKKNNKHSTFSSILCGLKDKVKQQKHSNNLTRYSHIDSSVTDSNSSDFSSASTKRSLTPELVRGSNNNLNINNGKMNTPNKFPSSISSPNLSKQDSGSSTTSSSNRLINLSEDYSYIVAERERKMEERQERRMSGSRMNMQQPGGSGSNGEARTPKSKKKTVLLQPAPNREIKPSTILRLEDRDLIVIDKQDIKEAVRNESDVIIVDPPALPQTPSESEHADLSDILAGPWPESAGATGSLLNNSTDRKFNTYGNGYRSIERNKSANIASHFSTSSRYDSHNGYRKSK